MFDEILFALRRSKIGGIDHGTVHQSRSAKSLFAGNFDGVMSVQAEFSRSRLGIGVMENLDGELVSLRGATWAVPSSGVPRVAHEQETVAFGIAASGGVRHKIQISTDASLEEISDEIDEALLKLHIDHEEIVCAIEIVGDFRDVVLRTVHQPDYEGETLGEIIDDEVRFSFNRWTGTLVGFRYPDKTSGLTIPGLHLHGISDDRKSGGHLRAATVIRVSAQIWLDDLSVMPFGEAQATENEKIDFDRFEGPISTGE